MGTASTPFNARARGCAWVLAVAGVMLCIGLVESPALLEGVLDVKMGGKNMTLAQRVRAERLGACP